MNITDCLDMLSHRARTDETLRQALLATKEDANPLDSFCCICRKYGYEIYPMEVVQAGEEFYASMRRSTNGGGENSPKLDGEDDFYELFLAEIR